MTRKEKTAFIDKWVARGIKEGKKWNNDLTKPFNTKACLNYLYSSYAFLMFEDGLDLNDIFYEARHGFKRLGIVGKGKNRGKV